MEAPLGGSGSGPERDKSTAPPSSSPISVVSAFWKDFELEKEKTVLDEQGLRIAENQENSQKNRRKLAENTRDFKKASPEDKLSLFNSLLKGYQEEVDNLTKRAKFGENAFLNIYQKLYEAPDPYPALVSIAEQDLKLSELESENRKMKVELEEFRTEATHLKNQQATIRRLEERNRQLEQQMEEKVKEIVEIKQRSLAEENQKTLEVLKERYPSIFSAMENCLFVLFSTCNNCIRGPLKEERGSMGSAPCVSLINTGSKYYLYTWQGGKKKQNLLVV